jgi:hypothetical protein
MAPRQLPHGRDGPQAPRRCSRIDIAVGTLALAAIALHDAAHIQAGHWFNAFWVCNIAALLAGPAVLFGSPVLSGAALTWLLPGTAVWLLDAIVAGSTILPTSYAVHLGGTAVAVYGLRRAGRLHGVHRPAVFAASMGILGAAVVVSRWALPAAANVNAAHSVPRGWSFLGAERVAFILSAGGLAVGVALAGAWLARAIGGARA